MKHITVRDIVKATEGTLILMNGSDEEGEIGERILKDICIDSRIISEGDLFIPLLGENVDGHKYLPEAMKTAAAALTSKKPEELYPTPEAMEEAKKRGDVLILVEDTEKAEQDVGAYIRMQYEPPVIGVTGSVGKTTTRRMIVTALSGTREVYETPGNYNSRYGIPIATSRMLDQPSEAAVLEMGIDRIGEMDILRYVARPEIAVVTMIGTCHMEYFGDQETIREQKLLCASKDTVLFLNGDDPMLWEMKGKAEAKEVLYYGFNPEAEYRAEEVSVGDTHVRFVYCHGDVKVPVELPVLGDHNVRNAVVAMAICDYLGLDLDQSAKALEDFRPMRQITKRMPGGTVVIDDTYNASPDSMKALLSVLNDYPTEGSRWAVLGDMFELGATELEQHAGVGDTFAQVNVDHLITVGERAKVLGQHAASAKPELDYHAMDSLEAAAEYLKEQLAPEDVVVLKASHGMHFDRIVEALIPKEN